MPLLLGLLTAAHAAGVGGGAPAASSRLTVDVASADATTAALIQYTYDGTSYTEVGVYTTATITAGKASFNLSNPTSAATTAGGGTVVLAVVIEDAEGQLLGLSEDVVGWYPTAPAGAPRKGWLIGRDQFLSSASSYGLFTSGLAVEDNLLGDKTLTLTGTMSGAGFTTRVTAAPSDTSAPAPADDDAGRTWSLTFADAPDPATLTAGKHFDIGYFPLTAYVDSDGDHLWTRASEALAGSVCSGTSALAARYVSAPTTLADAAAIWHKGLEWGWVVGVAADGTMTPVSTAGLRIRLAC